MIYKWVTYMVDCVEEMAILPLLRNAVLVNRVDLMSSKLPVTHIQPLHPDNATVAIGTSGLHRIARDGGGDRYSGQAWQS